MSSIQERALAHEKRARWLLNSVRLGWCDPSMHPILIDNARRFLLFARCFRLKAASCPARDAQHSDCVLECVTAFGKMAHPQTGGTGGPRDVVCLRRIIRCSGPSLSNFRRFGETGQPPKGISEHRRSRCRAMSKDQR